MATLRMKGVRCASLEDFRKNFDFTNAKDYLRQGRLSPWVRDLGENDLADELEELKEGEYSDQTLLDNFIGIFGLKIENAGLPQKEVSILEEDTLPDVCEVTIDPQAVLYSVEYSQKGIQRFLKNKIVLKIIREIALKNLPEDGHCNIVITVESNFVNDLKFSETQLNMLAQLLNEEFDRDEKYGFATKHPYRNDIQNSDHHGGIWVWAHYSVHYYVTTVEGLLSYISIDSDWYKPKSYIYADVIHLLDGVF